MRRILLCSFPIFALVIAASAGAGSLDHAKIALHAHTYTLKGLCTPLSQGGIAPDAPCSELQTAASLNALSIIYLLAAQADSGQGFSALSCGVTYSPGVQGLISNVTWHSCANTYSYDGPNGPWPFDASGVRVDWSTCQTLPPLGFANEGAMAIAGAIEMSAEGEGWLEIVENPQDPSGPALKVFDCNGAQTMLPIASAGKVRFSSTGTEPGFNPCSATPVPTCLVSPRSVDFGTVYIPDTKDTTVTVWNPGTTVIDGAVSILSAPPYYSTEFFLRSGVNGFRLEPGAHLDLRIEYQPTSRPSRSILSLGPNCPGVELLGTGLMGIQTIPGRIDFGVVPPDSVARDSFQVVNISPVRLVFQRVTSYNGLPLECPDFSLPRMSFDLAPGDQTTRTVSFSAGLAGSHECTLFLGSLHLSVHLQAQVDPGKCDIEPESIDFGTIWTDQPVDTTITLVNQGLSTLDGYLSNTNGAFRITSGPNTFTLSPGESLRVGIRFQPDEAGAEEGQITFGRNCPSVQCTGTGRMPCDITPTVLNFGRVPIGTSSAMSFQIYNVSDHPLSGRIELRDVPNAEILDDPRFSLIEGAGPFTLEPNGILVARVQFDSRWEARALGDVETGLPCGKVNLTASGRPLDATSPARLPLHLVPHGAQRVCPPLLARDPDPSQLPCASYVGNGQSRRGEGYDVYLLAAHLPRPAVLGVDFGIAYNSDPQRGVDVFSWTSCSVLEFRSDTWPQSGAGNLLTWNQATACADEDSLTGDPEGSRTVLGVFYLYAYSTDVFRITPRTFVEDPGPHFLDCSLVETYIGPPGCGSVVFTPDGTLAGCNPCLEKCSEQGPLCAILPTSVDFGSVPVGGFADTLIHVMNTSSRSLTGQPILQDGPFSLPDEAATIALEPGDVRDLRLRFHPVLAGQDSTVLRLGTTCPFVTLMGRGVAEAPGPELAATARWAVARGAEIQVSGAAWEENGKAEIRIYDVLGRVVHEADLQSSSKSGSYIWPGKAHNGRRASAGVYYVLVKVSSFSASTSFLLLP